jgi:hypothetical protein
MARTASSPQEKITLRQAIVIIPNGQLHFGPMKKEYMHLIDKVT